MKCYLREYGAFPCDPGGVAFNRAAQEWFCSVHWPGNTKFPGAEADLAPGAYRPGGAHVASAKCVVSLAGGGAVVLTKSDQGWDLQTDAHRLNHDDMRTLIAALRWALREPV